MLSISLMRWIDQSVGTVVCHAFAAAKVAAKPFVSQPTTYKKIAVLKFFGIGSIVVSSAALAALREEFPEAKIFFVTFKSNKEVLDILGLTDRTILIDNSSLPAFVRTTLEAVRELAREKVDVAVDFEFFAKYPLVLASLAGIPKKVGFYLSLEPWRQALLDMHGFYNHYFHVKDIFLSLVYLLKTGDKYYLDFAPWRDRYKYPRRTAAPADVARVRQLLAEHGYRDHQRLVVINPNAAPHLATNTRLWPEDRYAELANRTCAEYPGALVVLSGAPGEKGRVDAIAKAAANPRVVSLAGKLSLGELLALFSLADLLVSNDSGPMHLACLVDVPVVGLFFADTPVLYAPLASRAASVVPELYSLPLYTVYAGKSSSLLENVPARLVSVDRVLGQVRELLARTNGAMTAAEGLQ